MSTVSAAALLLVLANPSAAQEIIDGTTVNVPGDRPNPWTFTTGLIVGDTTTGVLNILSTGVVTNNTALTTTIVGNQAGADGTVTITGPNAQWNSVGVTLGNVAGSQGSVIVTGPSATWNAGDIGVGNAGTGTLSISGGGTVSNNATFIAGALGAEGVATITGAGSVWNAATFFTVGGAGLATFTVSDGAQVSDVFSALADGATSVATATITGAGSQWNGTTLFYIGKSGDATLNILDGGSVSTGTATMAYYAGAQSNVTVSGDGSTLTASDLIGRGGTLTVSDGGVVNSGSMSGGIRDDFSALITGAGSEINITGDFLLGGGGTTSLLIESGGVVNDGVARVSYGATTTLSGAGSQWNSTTSLNIDDGTLDITDGGVATSGAGTVGMTAGTVSVTGDGSRWDMTGNLNVGFYGTGALDIQDGGVVTSADARVGVAAYYGVGDVTITGTGSSWQNSGDLFVGVGLYGYAPASAFGTVTVSDGATMTSANAFLGQYGAGEGTVTVTGTDSSWTNTGNVIVGDAGIGTLQVTEGGTATTATLTIANQVDSIGTVIIGAESGQPAALRGTLDATDVVFGAGTGTLVFNHTDTVGYTFASDMSGTGIIDIESGRTIFTGDSTAFAGTTTIGAAQLAVNGTLGGDIDVGSGGTLSGDGTVGGFTAMSGSRVAPGNSIGTLSVTGNVAFNAGSIYQVEIDSAGQSDLIDATGTATLSGGTVQVTSAPGTYVPYTYTILTAAAGLTGTFAAVTDDLALLESRLLYDANNVMLELYLIPNFCAAAQTANECSVATALGRFPGDNPLSQAVIGLNSEGARQAFNALSGEIHATVSGTLANDSRYVREALGGRLLQAQYSNGAGEGVALASSSAPTNVASIESGRMSLGALRGAVADDGDIASADPGRITYWSRAFGTWGQFDGDGNAATADRSLGGFLTGADAGIGNGWRAGVATGYMQSSIGVGARSSSADVNSFVLAGYAGGSYGDLAVRTGAAWTWNAIDTTRNVIFPGFYELEEASYNAGTGQVFGEFAIPMAANNVAWEPYLGLAYVQVDTGSFTESGATAALTANDKYQGVGFSTLGGRVATTVPVAGIMTTPHASLAWQYAFGSTTPEQGYVFASTGIGFGIAGVPLARSSALLEAGVDVSVAPNATLGLSYAGQLASSLQDNGVRGRLNWKY